MVLRHPIHLEAPMNDTHEANRFAPPNAQLIEAPPADIGPRLATRWQRFCAAFVDGLFAGVVLLSVFAPMYGMSTATWMHQFSMQHVGGLLINYALYLGVQGWFLHQSGQSVGKKAVGLRIVRPDGSRATIGRLGSRLLITTFGGVVPVIGKAFALIDILLIFGGARRCLHDYIAGTIVATAASTPHATRLGDEGQHLRTANF